MGNVGHLQSANIGVFESTCVFGNAHRCEKILLNLASGKEYNLKLSETIIHWVDLSHAAASGISTRVCRIGTNLMRLPPEFVRSRFSSKNMSPLSVGLGVLSGITFLR